MRYMPTWRWPPPPHPLFRFTTFFACTVLWQNVLLPLTSNIISHRYNYQSLRTLIPIFRLESSATYPFSVRIETRFLEFIYPVVYIEICTIYIPRYGTPCIHPYILLYLKSCLLHYFIIFTVIIEASRHNNHVLIALLVVPHHTYIQLYKHLHYYLPSLLFSFTSSYFTIDLNRRP